MDQCELINITKWWGAIKGLFTYVKFSRQWRNLPTTTTWGMRFNAKKCYIMSISTKSTHFYQLDGYILQQVPEKPYLCVMISEALKWSSPISKITKKAYSTLGFLKRNLKKCLLNCRMTAYISLI